MPRLHWLWACFVCGCFVVPPPLAAESSESGADADAETSDAPANPSMPEADAEEDGGEGTTAHDPASSSTDDGAVGTSGEAIDCAPTPAGIVAWWRGDGDMTDSIGGAAANAVGGLDANAAGYVEEAFHFDGVDDALAIDDALVFAEPTDAFTVEAWVRLDALEQPGTTDATVPGDMEIIGKMVAGATPNADGWRLFKQTDADELWFCVGALDNGCREDGDNTVHTAATPIGEWLHVAAVRDGDRIAIHLDGMLVGESTLVAPIDTSAAAVSIGASTAEITDDFTSFFFGTIDEVALYDRALADDELEALANATAGKCR
jgi:hypothetical protein